MLLLLVIASAQAAAAADGGGDSNGGVDEKHSSAPVAAPALPIAVVRRFVAKDPDKRRATRDGAGLGLRV